MCMKNKKYKGGLKAVMEKISDEKVLYCPNPGNAGDSAIATATYQLFDKFGVRYHCVEWNDDFDATEKIVVYGGGGNLVEKYPQARAFLERHHESAKHLVLLPHTIQGNTELLNGFGDNTILFCRERRSFETAREHTDGPKIYLEDDLAFGLEPQALIGEEPFNGSEAIKRTCRNLVRSGLKRFASQRASIEPALPLRTALGSSGRLVRSLIRRGRSVLYAFRTDKEGVMGPFPPTNVDPSLLFNYGVAPRSAAESATAAMLSFLNCYDRIVTDRLHGCILAALLGKKVDFYANDYFKNESVYRFSMEEEFPNVNWCRKAEKRNVGKCF